MGDLRRMEAAQHTICWLMFHNGEHLRYAALLIKQNVMHVFRCRGSLTFERWSPLRTTAAWKSSMLRVHETYTCPRKRVAGILRGKGTLPGLWPPLLCEPVRRDRIWASTSISAAQGGSTNRVGRERGGGGGRARVVAAAIPSPEISPLTNRVDGPVQPPHIE